jgi:hypothetical protein
MIDNVPLLPALVGPGTNENAEITVEYPPARIVKFTILNGGKLMGHLPGNIYWEKY